MSDWGKIAGGIAGFFIGGPQGAVIGAAAGDALFDQPRAAKKQAGAVLSAQERIAAERLELERGASAQYLQLTEQQMKFQMGQQQVELLTNLLSDQDRTESRVLTLPTSAPTRSIFDQLNLWIDRLLNA